MKLLALACLLAAVLAGCKLANTATDTQTGPFRSTCTVFERGVAWVTFHNEGGRDQSLQRFNMIPVNKRGKRLEASTITFLSVQTLKPGESRTFHENITYAARTCKISRVRRPIGINIGSRTPPEIAISTLAGLIADRNGKPGGFAF